MNHVKLFIAVTVLATVSLPHVGQAQNSRLEGLGSLACDVTSRIQSVTKAKEDVACIFTDFATRSTTSYLGKIFDFDIDIGEIKGGHMTWLVDSPDAKLSGLEGTYRSELATPVLDLPQESKVLSRDGGVDVILQPYMLDGNGLNFAVGVTALQLTPAE